MFKSVLTCLFAVLLLTGSGIWAQAANPREIPRDCVDCHDDEGKALAARGAAHQEVGCRGCHVGHPLEGRKPYTDCVECHDPAASEHYTLPDCASCHDPHKPLDVDFSHLKSAKEVCAGCHADPIPPKTGPNPHAEMGCNECHVIHSQMPQCLGCHEPHSKEMGQKDCLGCHTPHASAENTGLLTKQDPALCLDCHKTDGATFKKKHMNYPVEQARCSTCHDPHGSNSGAILADHVHAPIKNQMCSQCHNEPESAQPFAVKKSSFELCQGCHYEMVNTAFGKNRLHWPLVDKTGCINCHTPHASSEPGLLKDKMLVVCGQCHADTLARQERSQTKHQPIHDGECTVCHSPHASDNIFLQKEASSIASCAQCHDWQTHSSHPLGDEVVDPRNRNLSLDCLSCHRTHGTEYVKFLYYSDVQTLCVQCHTKYRR